MTRSATFVAISAVVLVAGWLGLLGLRHEPQKVPVNAVNSAHPAELGQPPEPEPGLRRVREDEGPSAPLPPSASVSAIATAPDERSLMTTLRELRGSAPERTLALARDGNQRFPSSPDVAERSWFIVKSLSDLGRHDEARAEGRILLQRFRDTRWGEDVYRHLFVNPPTHPFERGYGKDRELE